MDLYWVLKTVSKHGILVDAAQREQFRQKLLVELEVQKKDLDKLIPDELLRSKECHITPAPFRCKECKGRGHAEGKPDDRCTNCKGTGAKIGTETKGCKGIQQVPEKTVFIPGNLQGRDGQYYVRSVEAEGKFNWGFQWFFNSKSPLQVRKYIQSQGHPIPKDRETGLPTTGQKDLESLARRFPKSLYNRILEIRSISDLLSKYADNPWWAPAKDGRIHPSFSFTKTGRLSSSRPNIQNPIKRGKLGKEFRNQFIASNGMILVGIDFNAIEAVYQSSQVIHPRHPRQSLP